MHTLFRQIPLYRFLSYCEESGLEKNVLDCGAGGALPPLALFSSFGYDVHGVDIDREQIGRAEEFARGQGLDLSIRRGDMTNLDFQDRTMSFVYSYNAIFHMTKQNIARAMEEMKRVLKKDGLLFVNFLCLEDEGYGSGKPVGPGEFEQMEQGRPCLHTYHDDHEAEEYFRGMEILFKEKRLQERPLEGRMIQQGYRDYILKKIS